MKSYLSPVFLLLLLLSACQNNDMDDQGDPCSSDFDQQAMFENLADNLILPAFSDFQSSVTTLSQAVDGFASDQDLPQLEAVRQATLDAWQQWQQVAQYSFGPAEDVFLRSSLNNFPLDVDETETKILAEDTDFSNPETYHKGFPALDYLLFGLGADAQEVLDFYLDDADAGKYLAYLEAVADDIQTRTDQVVGAWQGDYRNTFIENTGTAAGTSLSLIINGLNQNYEMIKREKLGIPSGVLTLGFANPENVEARFSGISLTLVEVALEAAQDFYLGINGLGLDDYLQAVDAQKNGESLDQLIRMQFELALEAVRNLDSPLSEAVQNNQDAVIEAYNEVSRNVVNLKTDMPSVLCVAITYIDNPSDSD